ncbi:MAG: DUF3341 domain-containing protein [Candidatus Krumholzibacteriia bacterium]
MTAAPEAAGAGRARAPGLYGLLTTFEDVDSFVTAVRRVRDAGYRRWDAHSPFPVHAMDEAMGIHGTRLPWLVLGGGASGLCLAVLMQWWMNVRDYPYLISGKPYFSLPADIPVAFELTVLLAAVAAAVGMLVLNGLPVWSHPLLKHPSFRRATADRFYIVIETRDPRYDAGATRDFLASLGGGPVEAVEE